MVNLQKIPQRIGYGYKNYDDGLLYDKENDKMVLLPPNKKGYLGNVLIHKRLYSAIIKKIFTDNVVCKRYDLTKEQLFRLLKNINLI